MSNSWANIGEKPSAEDQTGAEQWLKLLDDLHSNCFEKKWRGPEVTTRSGFGLFIVEKTKCWLLSAA